MSKLQQTLASMCQVFLDFRVCVVSEVKKTAATANGPAASANGPAATANGPAATANGLTADA